MFSPGHPATFPRNRCGPGRIIEVVLEPPLGGADSERRPEQAQALLVDIQPSSRDGSCQVLGRIPISLSTSSLSAPKTRRSSWPLPRLATTPA